MTTFLQNGDHMKVEQLGMYGENCKELDEWIGDNEERKACARFHILMTTPVFGLYGYTIKKCVHQRDAYWKLPQDVVKMVLDNGGYIPEFARPLITA
jgi:hypothetical protein